MRIHHHLLKGAIQQVIDLEDAYGASLSLCGLHHPLLRGEVVEHRAHVGQQAVGTHQVGHDVSHRPPYIAHHQIDDGRGGRGGGGEAQDAQCKASLSCKLEQ